MKTHQELIDEVMDCFDFESVAKTMKLLDWEWAGVGKENAVPELWEIKKQARERLRYALNNEGVRCGSGGFESIYDDGVLELKFVVSDWFADEKESKP